MRITLSRKHIVAFELISITLTLLKLLDSQINQTSSSDLKKKEITFHVTSEKDVRLVPRGTNVQVADLQVHLTTAVYYPNYPLQDGVNLFLNGWARDKFPMDFKCCLHYAYSLNRPSQRLTVEIPAFTQKLYTQWIVDMQSAEFVCAISKKKLSLLLNNVTFQSVSFALNNCSDASTTALPIKYPKTFPNSVGVCLKISYGWVNPELIVEWFEYMKILGVTRVFTFLSSDLHPESLDTFLYYKRTGFLDADPIHPAKSNRGSERKFVKPRFEEQAWVDEVMACNDCKLRMSGFDYVIVMDLDEFIIPRSPHANILSILQETARMHPDAGAFGFNSHVVMLNWKQTRRSPLHIVSRLVRTTFPNLDGYDRNTRWAFKPHRAFYVKNNEVLTRDEYTRVDIPQRLFTLIHRRLCKPTWPGCLDTPNRRIDPTILRYEKPLIEAMQKSPVLKLLRSYNHTEYVDRLLSMTIF